MQTLFTTEAVIEVLGGASKVASLVGTSVQNAYNWQCSGRFPAKTFIVITSALAERGKSAPPELWGMLTPKEAHAAEAVS